MNAAIVGHGPKLLVNSLGYLIDQHDIVVRLKNGVDLSNENPINFGSKTDFVAASQLILSGEAPIEQYKEISGDKEFWVFNNREEVEHPPFLSRWVKYYNQVMGILTAAPYFSTGTAAVIMTCEYRSPDNISLFGFDAYLNPSAPYINAFGKVIKKGHLWALERLLIEQVASHYGINIAFI